MTFKRSAILVWTAFLVIALALPCHAAWETHVLISGESAGKYNSLDLDSNDEIGVSFYDEDGALRYLYKGETNVQLVDNSTSDVGLFTSLEFDGNEFPHISYHDNINGTLKYAEGKNGPDPSGNWDIVIVDTLRQEGEHSSLVLDSSGIPHISHQETPSSSEPHLRYSTKDNGNWTNSTIYEPDNYAVANGTSIAVNGNDLPRIAYRGANSTSLKFIFHDGGSWSSSPEVVDDNGTTGAFPSLEIDGNDMAHISYREKDTALKFASQQSGGNWTIEVVESGNLGTYTSLALDSDGNPHISYFGVNGTILKYAYHNSNIGWKIMDVDANATEGHTTSLELDSNQMPHISYYDGGNDTLKYATNPSFYNDVGVDPPSETSDDTSDDSNGGGGGCVMSPEASFGAGWLLLLLLPLMALRLRKTRL